MAFLKQSTAVVSTPSIYKEHWQEIRTKAARISGQKATSQFNKTASLNLSEFSPDKYLLTHCTIVASVEVETVPNVKLGSHIQENGQSLKRLWSDYHVKPESVKYVNSNSDCWSRQTLLNTYRTFVGAENYVEHVQIPELSKGKVIDAVARDLGDTVYIDILVATSRTHTTLIQDIESGRMSTLSMGCSINYSQCTKCGNVAADDTELCPCVKYSKGDSFIDESGVKRVIAELCGHSSDPDSVVFIEASWVANPAFKGAVLHSVLNPSMGSIAKEANPYAGLFAQSDVLSQFMTSTDIDSFFRSAGVSREKMLDHLQHEMCRIATLKSSFGFEDEEEEKPPEKSEHFIEDLKKEVKKDIEDELKKQVRKDIKKDLGLGQKDPVFKGVPEKEDLNDSIINSYQKFETRYLPELGDKVKARQVFLAAYKAKQTGWGSLKHDDLMSNRTILTAVAIKKRDFGGGPVQRELIQCLDKVGGTCNYNNPQAFLTACSLALHREPSLDEVETLVKIGQLLR
jgi:hypothetical protein